MKANTKRKVLSFVIMLALLFTMSSFMAISSFAYSANDYTVDSDRIQNEYLHLNYGGGHLYYYTARGENLLFPGTSAFYLNVDGRIYGDDYGHSQYVHKVSTDGLSMFSEISMGGVSVDRYITFALNTQTGRYDVAEFKYVITNDSDSTKSIGSRIMFDTMLGNNDHAPFKVNGQNVTTRTEFVGDAVPQNWQVFDNLMDPTVIGFGKFYNNVEERPDKVQFNNWGVSRSEIWNVSCNGGSIGDSAVNVYFNPVELAPGESRTVKTYYGVSEFVPVTCNHRDADDDLKCDYCPMDYDDRPEIEPIYSFAAQLAAPQVIIADSVTDTYEGNPFTVTAYIRNDGNMPLTNITATITLPEGLVLNGDSTLTINDLDVDAESGFSWSVTALTHYEETALDFNVTIAADNVINATAIDHSITLMAIDMPCDHTFGTVEVIDVAPTCLASGVAHLECAGCGEYMGNVMVAPAGHSYAVVEVSDASCTEDGYIRFECSAADCTATKTQVIDRTGHVIGADNTCIECGFVLHNHTHYYTSNVVDPTCVMAGYTTYTCSCGYSYRADYVSAPGHIWNDGSVITPNSCTTDGSMLYTCTICSASYTATIPAGHTWNETVTVAPTCTTEGLLTRNCASCGATETEVIPASHTFTSSEELSPAGCETPGLASCYCSACQQYIEVVIDPLGHEYINGVCTRCEEGFINHVTQGDHPEYGMYFEVGDVISNYGPDVINEYGMYLDHNEGAEFKKVAIFLTQDGTMWRRCIAFTGENIQYATYVPYLSYDEDMKYTGLNSDWINIFRLSESASGIWCYSNYATIGVNLQDNRGNLLLSLYDIGQAGTQTRIFDDLAEMIQWLSEDDNNVCTHPSGTWNIVSNPTNTSSGLKIKRCNECNAIIASEAIPPISEAFAKIETNVEHVLVGDEVTFTVSISNCVPATALALQPQFDSNYFDFVSASWLVPATIQNINPNNNQAVSTWETETDINTYVYTFTLRAKEEAVASTCISSIVRAEVNGEVIELSIYDDFIAVLDCDHSNSETVAIDDETHRTTCLDCGYFIDRAHYFDGLCDADCDGCGYERVAPHSYSTEYTTNEVGHWHVCTLCGGIDGLVEHSYDDNTDCNCNGCGYVRFIRGDVDNDGDIDSADTVYLTYSVLFGAESYPVYQGLDYNGDGRETSSDAVYLLYYIFFGSVYYPLH